MSGRDRDSFADAGRAMRATIDRAVKVGLTGRQWRVLAAVLWYTASWSKLCDDVTLDRIGAVAGFSLAPDADEDNPVLTKTARRSLRRDIDALVQHGVILFEPGGGRRSGGEGIPSTFRLPHTRAQEGPRMAEEGGPRRVPKGGPGESRKGAQVGPLPEKGSEELSEKGARAGARDPAPTESTDVENLTPVERAMAKLGVTGPFEKLSLGTQTVVAELAEKIATDDDFDKAFDDSAAFNGQRLTGAEQKRARTLRATQQSKGGSRGTPAPTPDQRKPMLDKDGNPIPGVWESPTW